VLIRQQKMQLRLRGKYALILLPKSFHNNCLTRTIMDKVNYDNQYDTILLTRTEETNDEIR
jgi:hypothetical protein